MSARSWFKKIGVMTLLLLAVVSFYHLGGHHYLNFTFLKTNLMEYQALYQERPFLVLSIFLGGYVFLTSLSIPGSIVLTILGGALFGTALGTLIVTLAGTIGAGVAFLLSRYLFRKMFQRRFATQFKSINRNLDQSGVLYLFTLRFIPVSPFVVINLVLGLTNMRLWTFIWTTFLGMLPGNFIYVYAGEKMSEINSPAEIMSLEIIIALTLLGVLPFLTKKIINSRKKKTVHV